MSDATGAAGAVVCFAVPDESRLFTRGLANRRVVRSGGHSLPTVYGELEGRAVTVVHTGVGDSSSAREHLARVLGGGTAAPGLAISAGYAGALDPNLRVGDLVLGANYSAENLASAALRSLAALSVQVGSLVTKSAAVERAVAKAALHRSTGALAVDMETAWIADACAAAGLPLLSLRVISDAANQDFPVPGHVLYDAARQRPRYLALPAWLALHPGRITPFARFVRGLGPAREQLTKALLAVLENL